MLISFDRKVIESWNQARPPLIWVRPFQQYHPRVCAVFRSGDTSLHFIEIVVSLERKAVETWDQDRRVQRPRIRSHATHSRASTTLGSRVTEQHVLPIGNEWDDNVTKCRRRNPLCRKYLGARFRPFGVHWYHFWSDLLKILDKMPEGVPGARRSRGPCWGPVPSEGCLSVGTRAPAEGLVPGGYKGTLAGSLTRGKGPHPWVGGLGSGGPLPPEVPRGTLAGPLPRGRVLIPG